MCCSAVFFCCCCAVFLFDCVYNAAVCCLITGLRWACLCAVGLITVGSALRCVTSDPFAAKWQVTWSLKLVIAMMVHVLYLMLHGMITMKHLSKSVISLLLLQMWCFGIGSRSLFYFCFVTCFILCNMMCIYASVWWNEQKDSSLLLLCIVVIIKHIYWLVSLLWNWCRIT